MFKKISRLKYFCGLDIGVSSIKVSLIKIQDEQNMDLLGVFETKSHGFKDASVSDLTELADAISHAVTQLCTKYGVKVSTIQLGIGSECVHIRKSSAVIPLVDTGTKVISRSDIKKVDHQAKLLGPGIEEEIIHDFPLLYKVDDVTAAVNPLGLYGRKVESNLLLVLVNTNRLRNMVKAVHQAGFEVGAVSLSSFAASKVAIEDSFKNQGVILVDIGSEMTSALFFSNGLLGDIQFIPWGGHYLTQSLSERLSLTMDLAEDIKKTHAVASLQVSQERSGEILIKREKDYLPIRREAVCEAVNWEIENLLTHLETVIQGSPLFHEINSGIVMVGGAALLPGLIERIEGRLKIPVSLGMTKGLNNAPLFASAIGLAQLGYLKNLKETVDLKTPIEFKDRFIDRMRELCQEYF